VKAKVSGAIRPNAILVPQESVQQGAESHFVYVVNEEKRAEVRNVQVGDWYQEYWIINSGLNKGDQVIVAGVNKIKEGTPIKVIKRR
jgi:membrane fusion protein (multidrug efflux system)